MSWGKRLVFLGMVLAALLSAAPRLQSASRQTLSGVFLVVWGDPPRRGLDHRTAYLLADDHGGQTRLAIPDHVLARAGGPLALDRRRVEVTGEPGGSAAAVAGEAQVLAVDDVRLLPGATAQAQAAPLAGSRKWVTLLCRFSDRAGETPQTRAWFQTLMTGTTPPGMDHYWRQQSYGAIDLVGSRVSRQWRTLPDRQRDYVDSSGTVRFQKALTDCATVHDADVDFTAFTGVVLVFNGDIGCCAWGGGGSLTLDSGQPRFYSVAWMPPWAWRVHGVMAHEMAHGFGLPHSSGSYSTPYDSKWDPLSDPFPPCSPADPIYGCVGVHTIGYHKDRLAWIPPARKHVAGPGRKVVRLERLALPGGTDPLLAVIPFPGDPGRFYTVEARQRAGYDVPIPGDAVVIHEVDPARPDRTARVVDPDFNGNPNDEGAMWHPGETFVDAARGIRVTVTRALASGFQVAIEVDGPDLVVSKVEGVPALPAAVPAGGSLVLRDTTRNAGPLAAGPSITRYRLSPDANVRAGFVVLGGKREVPALKPGKSSTGRTTVKVPAGTAPGTYHVGACADVRKVVAEEAETNNCTAAAVTIQVTAP